MTHSLGENTATRTASPEGPAKAGGGVQTPSPARRPRRGTRIDWRKTLEITLLSGPAIVVFLAFVIFPVFLAAYYGFFSWKGYGPPTEFVGLDNYLVIFRDSAFHEALLHNGYIVVLSLILQGPAAVALALLLNQKIRGRSIIRVLIFVPYVISEVIVGTGWSLMLQTSGAVNDVCSRRWAWGSSPSTGCPTPGSPSGR
jgi:multiple sugar transport system permease protein/raffinose/stachyose/melibiose transport system permease protein